MMGAMADGSYGRDKGSAINSGYGINQKHQTHMSKHNHIFVHLRGGQQGD